jgi:carboxypeptidase Taq
VDPNLHALKERVAEITDLYSSLCLLGWDQRVTMPPAGYPARAEALATLGRIHHERLVDDEMGRLLDRLRPLEESLDYDSDDASLIRVTRRDWEKKRKVPPELQGEIVRAAALGSEVWVKARATNDFASFLPVLERNLDLKRRYAECFEWTDSPYTPLLDDFEPFMTTVEVAEVFCAIRPRLSALVRDAPHVDASFLEHPFSADGRRELAERIVSTFGFEDGSWRLDPTAHPFCTWCSTRDVRLTTRYRETGLASLWGTMHEAGHGLYAHGFAPSLERTTLAEWPSLAISESQSRTWENLVGRSRAFWTYWYQPLRATFPKQLGDVDLDAFVSAINRAEAGPIRVLADETTYSLHIILRFELERRLVEGALEPSDLPEAWNMAMLEYLGVEVPDDTQGVLQDMHWSQGWFGYFPTYALGNAISLQIWTVVREAIPDLSAQLEAGELHELASWLRDNLYSLGRKFTPKETLERVTGTPEIDPGPYVAYLHEKVAGLPAGAD